MEREGKGAYREIYWPNAGVLEITHELVRDSALQELTERFASLRGADLIYACLAKLRDLPLVTTDNDFDNYQSDIKILNPLVVYAHLRGGI